MSQHQKAEANPSVNPETESESKKSLPNSKTKLNTKKQENEKQLDLFDPSIEPIPLRKINSSQFKFYSIVKNVDSDLNEIDFDLIRLDDATKESIANQYFYYLVEWSNLAQHSYQPSHRASKNEIFLIPEFPLPRQFTSLHKKNYHRNYKTFSTGYQPLGLLGIYSESSFQDENEKLNYFIQVIDSGNIIGTKKLKRGRITRLVGWVDGSFSFIENDIFVMPKTMTCIIYKASKLLFSSYSQTSKILDLTMYFEEATEIDIENIMGHRIFESSPEVIQTIISESKDNIKKKFSILKYFKILDSKKATIAQIKKAAKNHKVELVLTADKKKIVFPHDSKQASDLLDLIMGRYFVHEITRQKCKANSFRVI